jgi:hypothetical protein
MLSIVSPDTDASLPCWRMEVQMIHRSLAISSLVAFACVSACAGGGNDSEEPIAPAVTEDGSADAAPDAATAPSASEPSDESSSRAVEDDDVMSFAADVSPILQANCSACHATGTVPRFASSDASVAYPIAVEHSDDIVGRLEQGTMPPSCGRQPPGSSGCISAADFDAIQRWVEDGTRE